MKRRVSLFVISAAAVATALPTLPGAIAAPSDTGVSHRNIPVCAAPTPGVAECHAILNEAVDPQGHPAPAATSPRGLAPADIESAYELPTATSAAPTGPWVAIVDAYDDPNAQNDLNVYRRQFNLPACPAGSCFVKLNQKGTSGSYPRANGGWAQEISLDLDMVSAACPNCRILLVEANSNSFSNLAAAVNAAAHAPQKPVAISNSYGGSDQGPLSAYDQPGIAVTASTGDGGYGVESPASFDSVIAVGGTSLTNVGGIWAETAWNGAGSGCSTQNVKPTWQTAATQCSGKANADVSAVADPNTGVAVYDSLKYQGRVGWLVFGGTSASSPIIASVYALANNYSSTPYPAALTWSATAGLYDVTSGSNGTCTPTLWCTSGTGWDGPTGLGSPRGTSAF